MNDFHKYLNKKTFSPTTTSDIEWYEPSRESREHEWRN